MVSRLSELDTFWRVDVGYLPILNILVLHTGHTPWVAGRPFFIVIAFGFFISLLVRHLTQ
jgi:hypothetical protein